MLASGWCYHDMIFLFEGPNVAKYSSQHLAKIVIESEDFKKGEYKDSLRKGFLQIDTDLRAGKHQISIVLLWFYSQRKDPEYENETSGCTAIVALLTKDNVLFVASIDRE